MKLTDWSHSNITQLLNINLPIIQAPMAGGASTVELVAAVSQAGGLGSLALGYMTADDIRLAIQQTKLLTNQPFAVNLFIPENHHATMDEIEQGRHAVQLSCQELHFKVEAIKPPYSPSFEEQMTTIIEENISVLSFTFGMLTNKWVSIAKQQNIKLIGTATSVEEAIYLEKQGVDAIVMQGSEAGGHRGTFIGKAENALTPLSSLLASVIQHVNLPVIAAGGIMDTASIVNAFRCGAAAVQMGTAFLCCHESGIHSLYKKRLLNVSHDHTTLTRAFSGKLARGIINQFITRMQAHENVILDYPIQNALTHLMRKEAAKQNNIDFMSMWAGQKAYLCKALPAADLIKELNNELMRLPR